MVSVTSQSHPPCLAAGGKGAGESVIEFILSFIRLLAKAPPVKHRNSKGGNGQWEAA